MKKIIDKTRKRLKRKASIRKKIHGTPERPRLTVYKSNRYTYVQAIDDAAGATLAAASNLEKEHRAIGTRWRRWRSSGFSSGSGSRRRTSRRSCSTGTATATTAR